MIGYIQEESHQYWESKINHWIDGLIQAETDILWQNEDKLIPNSEVSDFISYHQRISGRSITLYHFWINLN